MQNLLTTPLYDTLGPDAAEQVIQGAGVSVVFASMDKVATVSHIRCCPIAPQPLISLGWVQLAGIHDRGHCPNFKVAVIMPLQPFDKSAEFPKVGSFAQIVCLLNWVLLACVPCCADQQQAEDHDVR